jgi:transcriptional regulator with XRE-family HTH domain
LARIQDEYRAIGQRLQAAREAQRLSQADLARVLNVEPATYSRYEAGLRRITVPDLRRLARALEVGLDDLLGAETPPRSPEALLRELAASIAAGEPIDPGLRAMMAKIRQLPPDRRHDLEHWLSEHVDGPPPPEVPES